MAPEGVETKLTSERAGGLLLGESANSQAVTAKGFQELLNFFTSALLESIDGTFQKYNLEHNSDLLAGTDVEINQPNVTLEDKEEVVRIEMEVGTGKTKDLAEAFTQLIEKQQVDSLPQTDKSYRDNFWSYSQRNELIDYTSKKSRYGGFKPEEIILRRERVLKIHQPQVKIQKFPKIKAGGKKKDWKKYRKKGRMEA